MKIKVSYEKIDRLDVEAVVLFNFMDQRPLKGACGFIDWRMNGYLSRLILDGSVDGDCGESLLIDPGRRLRGDKILVWGLGESRKLNRKLLKEQSREMTGQLIKIGVRDFAVAPPAAGGIEVDVSKLARAIVEGIMDAFKGVEETTGAPGVTFSVEKGDYESVSAAIKKIEKKRSKPKLELITSSPIEASAP